MNFFGKSETQVPVKRIHDGRHCDLCGCSFPAVRCDKCSSQLFCLSCDDMYHRHPKRHFHLRKAVDPTPIPQARPMLPMKVSNLPVAPGDPSKMPLPPPRKKKPGKSIFDSFRRGSPAPAVDSPGLPKKEYSWTDRLGSITKFMSNRPLPPVPVLEEEGDVQTVQMQPPAAQTPDHSMSFLHKRVEEKPPALPQRQPRSQDQTPSPTMADVNGNDNKPVTNGNGPMPYGTTTPNSDMNQNWMMHQNMHHQSINQSFGTIRRSSQPQERSNTPGMQHSSSTSNLSVAADPNTMPGAHPYLPHPFNPHMPPSYPYPMFPQYPPYPQYFGNSWANLATPLPTTDPDLSDQSESSSRRFNRGKHKGPFEKKAKRSQSVMMDRMAYPGHFYPYGPFPPGYVGPPWMQDRPMDTPPSPATSLRSLSRLSSSQRIKKTTDDDDDYEDDFSSSPLSRPKSSSSEISKNRARAKHRSVSSSSSSEQENRSKHHSRSKPSPAMERRNLKLKEAKKRMPSPAPSPVPQSKQDAKKDNVKTFASSFSDSAEFSKKDTHSGKQIAEASSTSNEVQSISWECRHCTFINPSEERICQVCCKSWCPGEPSSTPVENRRQSADSIKSQTADDIFHDAESSHRRDIESLNSALDEAEKQINQSLVELLQVKEETTSTATEKAPSKTKKSFLKKFSSKKKHTSNGNVQESAAKVNHVTEPSVGNVSNLSNSYPATLNQGSQNGPQRSTVDTGTQLFSEKSRIEQCNDNRKDSFCQTYQDAEEAVPSTSYQPTALGVPKPFERTGFLQSPSPTMDWQHMMPDSGFGYGGLHRALSQASVFRTRTANALAAPVDYNSVGMGPSSLCRSLSRASLLGEMDNFGYMGRSKPDFYLSMEELVERRRQETMRAQGLELVRMIREAEQQGFTADDIQVALNNCGKQNPVSWLQENWKNIIKTVVTLATNYGKDKKENDVGTVSENEARDAVRFHKGNIWAAVTECVEGRQRKFLELNARGNFAFKNVVDALTASEGDVEIAYAKLSNTSIKPFLMRIWGSGEGVPNLEGPCFVPIDPENFHEQSKSDNEDIGDTWEDGYGEDENWVDEEVEDEEDDGEGEASVGMSSQDIGDYASEPEKSEKYHTLTREERFHSPESDKSDYCDAFGSGLGDRYLSSTSIDEIYLIDPEMVETDAQFEPQPKKTSKKSTGFLSKLAALRKDNKSEKLKKGSNTAEISKLEDEAKVIESSTSYNGSNSFEETIEKEDSKAFHPLSILKTTFSALKDSVVGATPKSEKKNLSMQDRRTIIVHDQPLQDMVFINESMDKKDAKVPEKELDCLSNATMGDVLVIDSTEQIDLDFDSKEVSTIVENLSIAPELSVKVNPEFLEGSSTQKDVTEIPPTIFTSDGNVNKNEIDISSKTDIISSHKVSKEEENIAKAFVPTVNTDNRTVEVISSSSESLGSDPNIELSGDVSIDKPLDLTNDNFLSQEQVTADCVTVELNDSKPVDTILRTSDKIVEDLTSEHVIPVKQSNELSELQESAETEQERLVTEPELILSQNDAEEINTLDEPNLHGEENQIFSLDQTLHDEALLSENNIADVTDKEQTVHDEIQIIEVHPVPETEDNVIEAITPENDNATDVKNHLNEEVRENNVTDKSEAQIQPNDAIKDDIVSCNIENQQKTKITDFNKSAATEENLAVIPSESHLVDEPNSNFSQQNVQEDAQIKTQIQFPVVDSLPSSAIDENTKIINTEKSDIASTSEAVQNAVVMNEPDVLNVEKLSGENKVVKKKKKKKVETKNENINLNSEAEVPNSAALVENSSASLVPVESEVSNNQTEQLSVVQTEKSDISTENKILISDQPDLVAVPELQLVETASTANETLEVVENEEKVTPMQSNKLREISEIQEDSSVDLHEEPISNAEVLIENGPTITPTDENSAETVVEKLISTINSSIAVLCEPVIADIAGSASSNMGAQAESSLIAQKADESKSLEKTQDKLQPSSSSVSTDLHSEQLEKVTEVQVEEDIVPNSEATDTETESLEGVVNKQVPATVEAPASTSVESKVQENTSPNATLQESSSIEEDDDSNDMDDSEDILNQQSPGSIRPAGHLRRMSFNTRKEAIFRERNRDLTIIEKKPWFVEKKIETFKPALPKRSIRQQLEFERKIRKLVADRKCATYRKAEIVAQLMEMKFDEVEAIHAANECSNFDMAASFLQQECQLCAGKYPVGEIISMVHCLHKACKECIRAYFTIQIRDRTIMELLCPFCNEPDITDEDIAQDYFNHLDMMLKKLVDDDIHELFQRKLRDRVLMKDPNFRWCSQCSSGFITDPYLKRLICPDCNAITCALCRRLWEKEHEGVTCEVFAEWKGINDPEAQTLGLAKLLTEDGIDCPSCHFRYALAKGGCMHFKCLQCQHDFCSGCSKPFRMGKKCGLSEFCTKLGLHAHHPRNCLFYLRDKEPEDLQRLLNMNDINYDKTPTRTIDDKKLCEVLEQKETTQGMVDDICGKEVQDGFDGLCRIHYVEYLGQLVNKFKIDPIQIFGNDDLELVLKRASIRLPPKKYRESEFEYRDKLVQLIEEKLPLGEHDGS